MNAVRLSVSAIVGRLREAEAYGLIERKACINKGKVRVIYVLTKKGEETIDKLVENKRIGELVRTCRTLKKKVSEIEDELNVALSEV